MRTISAASMAKINERKGIEPINIVRIYWVDDTDYIDYADRSFDEVQGRLISLSDIEEVVNISGTSSSTTVHVVLSDSDGQLKEIFNAVDIHRKKVQILQWFTGLPPAEAFIIFEGEIASPIEWVEGDRTLSFEVLSKLEEREIGFSAEEGSFDYVPPNLIGKTWPLVFGTVVGVPALQIHEVPSGLTDNSMGVVEKRNYDKQMAELEARIEELSNYAAEAIRNGLLCLGTASQYEQKQIIANQDGTGEDFTSQIEEWYSRGEQYEAAANQYLDELYKARLEFGEWSAKKEERDELKREAVGVLGNYNFPQGRTAKVKIGGQIYDGYFDGGNFRVLEHPEPFTGDYIPAGLTTIDQRAVVTEFATTLPPQNFLFLPGGSFVQMGEGYNVDYIVALGFVNVLSIGAYYQGLYTGVPPNYYTVHHKQYGSLQATIVRFSQPLSSIDQSWSDQIYVNIQSTIGPSVVDILVYLITRYTKYTYATSFGAVRTYVDRFPANFALTERKNALQVLEEIAYQARCAIWFKGGKFYLKYLPAESASVETITEDDIDVNSLQVSYTPTEDIITKMTANWRPSMFRQGETGRVIFRNNIDKYGLLAQEFDFYIYNHLDAVEKAAEYWFIRRSNTWKRISFRAFLTKLKVETWDTITLDFDHPFIANGPVKAIVESAKFDSSTWKINITCWVPVRAGEMTVYPFAWPADLPVEYVFPIPGDINAGSPNNSGATGTLVDPILRVRPMGQGTRASRPRMDSGRQAAIGDANYNTSDFQLETVLDSREINVGTSPTLVNEVFRQKQVKPLEPIPFTDDETGARNEWFGIVMGHVENQDYKVDLYRKGITQAPTRVTATQFVLNENDIIPDGTPCQVTRELYKRTSQDVGRTTTIIEELYVMQVPVWIKPQPESTTSPPASPPPTPDPGPGVGFGSSGGDSSSGETTDGGEF